MVLLFVIPVNAIFRFSFHAFRSNLMHPPDFRESSIISLSKLLFIVPFDSQHILRILFFFCSSASRDALIANGSCGVGSPPK